MWQVTGGILILGFTLWNEISPKVQKHGGKQCFLQTK